MNISGAENITPKYIIEFCIKAAIHTIGMIEETPAAIIAIRKYSRIPVTALINLHPNVKFSVLKAIYFSSSIQAAKNPIAKPALLANDDIERKGSYKAFPEASRSIGYSFILTNNKASIIVTTAIPQKIM
ncbi:MAG: hypothetical protein KBG42_09910 [Lachnospiraceae bacterium]|nr:hypothetical protein [Lachnospiraceae bacterium]